MEKIYFLKFDYPEINQVVYDFKINCFKIQYKIDSNTNNRKAYYISLSKR